MSADEGKKLYERFCMLIEQGKATEACECLDKAVDLGNTDAIVAKAKIVGYEDSSSLTEYRRLVDMACEAGSGEAWAMRGDLMLLLPSGGEEIFSLDDEISRDKKEEFVSKLPILKKFDCYVKASELNWSDAFEFLGETLLNPDYSVLAERDAKKEAFEFFARGAKAGNEKCILHLAECLEDGVGTDKNSEKAVTIYKELAEHGNKDAMLHLCEIYSEGREGIPPDGELAKKYMLMTGLSR